MKRLFLYPAAAFLTLIIGLYVYLYFADQPNQFWRSFSGAQVTINGDPSPIAQVYRHPDGKLLINSNRPGGWYVYIPEEQNMARCNPIEYIPIPGYIYAYNWHDKEIPCALMTPVKFNDPEFVVWQNLIEFTSIDNERIRVSW